MVYLILLHEGIWFSLKHLLRILSYLQCVLLIPLSKTRVCSYVAMYLGPVFCSIDLQV